MTTIPDLDSSAAPALRRYRAGVAVRSAAAIGGGYLLSALATRLLATALPLLRVDAVVAATLSGLAIYPCAVLWCFGARSAGRAVRGVLGACALVSLALLAARTFGGAP